MVVLKESSVMATEAGVNSCRLLKLPAEVRNEIYELAFTIEPAGTEIDFMSATAPSKALLLCCKQLHSEAKGIYQTAYRCYWSTSTFIFHRQDAQALAAKVETCRDEDIAAICNVSFPEPHVRSSGLDYASLSLKGIVWELSDSGNVCATLFAVRAGSAMEDYDESHVDELDRGGWEFYLMAEGVTLRSPGTAASMAQKGGREQLTRHELLALASWLARWST